ncbi:preprotein translocase subunit SecY [Trebonia sp.]|uniref:preprotein translocase subunit SecY n=1 Tax=Trebonia sp. TaxID=2767075 RepID=UPI002616436E|nr:preprotein translocase subunit SecY [Trebonia sp.]
MLTAFIRAFRTPDLRKKLLFTLGILALFRFGSTLPTPGINEKNVSTCMGIASQSSIASVYQIVDLLSGNALKYMSVFALGIMPYITASIILQLLTVVIPRLETLKNEGQAGTAKITQYTRYLTIGLAILQSTGYIELARSGELTPGCSMTTYPIIPDSSVFRIATMVITMVAGTAVIMWMGELITDRGVGNGMSVLIFTQVIAVIPGELLSIYQTRGMFVELLSVIVVIVIFAFVVFMEQAQRRIPVQYAKRMVGRRMYGGTSTYIPMKVNQAGVIPVIFASSLLYIPQLAVSLFGNSSHPQSWVSFVQRYLEIGSTNSLSTMWLYMIAFFVLIIAFTFFYVSITFNPTEVADNMKKYGGFIPGIRPGRPTAEYLGYVLTRLTTPGSFYLGVVALFPLVALAEIGVGNQFPFSGVSLLIMVGVGLDTVKQIESQLQQRNYEGFLR